MYVYITVVSEDGRGVGFTRMYVYITVVSQDGVGGVRFHWDVCLHYCFQFGRQRSEVLPGCVFTVVSEDGRGVGFYRDVCLHYCCQ